ncbi:uncharacterized protein LOC130719586 [Lotus japonicus]|uniref:uncharacterized protein LOC130719586 n=1 Tax=Lotus japonicus TaxID=34305 RepID=UPI0025825E94|nr:uncharacterized protein LOC130719586 [Lotus japonicus]
MAAGGVTTSPGVLDELHSSNLDNIIMEMLSWRDQRKATRAARPGDVSKLRNRKQQGKRIQSRTSVSQRSKQHKESFSVFVDGLGDRMTLQKLRAIFEKAGRLRDAFIQHKKRFQRRSRFGFLRFSSDEEAWKAIRMFHGLRLDNEVILEFESKEEMDDIIAKCSFFLEQKLYDVKPCTVLSFGVAQLVWIRLWQVPLGLWNESLFTSVGNRLGAYVLSDSATLS